MKTFFFPNKPIQIYNPERLIPSLGDLSKWVVQPKWNGKRVEICCSNRRINLYSREGRQWHLPEWDWLKELPLPEPWFLDGELLRDNRIYVWDYAVMAGKQVFQTPYRPRLEFLTDELTGFSDAGRSCAWSRGKYSLACIESCPVKAYDNLMARKGDPFLEGIVWKNLEATNSWGPRSTSKVSTQFKFRFLTVM